MADKSPMNAKLKEDNLSSSSMQVKSNTCGYISILSLPAEVSNQVNSVILALDRNQQIISQPQVTSSDQGNKGVVQGLKVFRDKQICEQMEEKFAETDEKHKKWLTVGPASSEPESSETGKELEVLLMEDPPEVTAVDCHSYSKNSKSGKHKNSDIKQVNIEPVSKRRRSKSTNFGKNLNEGIEQVACYKCKYCPYLSLNQDAVSSHVKQEHASQIPKENNGGMQCPGCDNIFYSVNSLRVHLSEDHNVAPEELENIISTFNSNISGGNTAPSCDKTPTLVKDWGKQSSVHSEAVQNIKGASNNGTVYIQDKSSIKTVQDQRKVSAVVLQGTSQVVLSKNLDKCEVKKLSPRNVFSKDETGKIRVRKMSSLERSEHQYSRNKLENEEVMESSPSISTTVSPEDFSVASDVDVVQYDVEDNSKEEDSRSGACDFETVQILDIPLAQEPDESEENFNENLNDDNIGTVQAMVVDSDGQFCSLTASPSSCEAILDEICQEQGLEKVLYVEQNDLLDHDRPLMVCFAASPSDLSGDVNYCDVEIDDDSLDNGSKTKREGNDSKRMILSSCELDGSDLIGPSGKKLVKRGFVKKSPAKKSAERKKYVGRKSKGKVQAANDASSVGFKCDIFGCPFRFQSQENLVYHQNCHASCAFSENSFSQALSELKSGTDTKAPVSKRKRIYTKFTFSCPECFVQLETWKQMRSHLWKIHSIDMEMYSCSQCDYKSTSLNEMKNVHEKIHGSEKPYLCDICGKGFKTTKQLRNHKYMHERSHDRLQTCEICGRSFNTLRMLQSHIDTVHNKVRPYMCSACGHTAANRSSLKIHLRQHTGDRPYICDQCEYSTPDHNSLRRHKKRHSGDKPYKCPYCPYACIQSTTYKIHVRSKHPGQDVDLIFSCDKCSFHSVSHDIYLAHIAEHDLEKTTGIPFRNISRASGKRKARKSSKCTDESFDDVSIFVNIATNEADEESPQPNFENIVQHVSEAIVPGSNLHVLYNSIPASGSKVQSTINEANASNSVIVHGRNQYVEKESESELAD